MVNSFFKKLTFFNLIIFIFISTLYANEQKLTIIYASSIPDITQNKIGNYAELSTFLKNKRDIDSNTIFLFGGNSLGPSPMSSLDKGVHIIDLLNFLEPDVMAVNKREFSFFEDELSLRSYEAAFPFVISNIYDPLTNDNIDGLHNNIIVKRDFIKIGIISIVEPNVTEEYATKRVLIKDIRESIKKQTFLLKQKGANIIILMASNIFNITDKLLSDNIIHIALTKNEYFNLSKTNKKPIHKNNFLITNKNDICLLELTIDTTEQTIKSLDVDFINIKNYKKDPIVLEQMTNYTNRLNQLLDDKIGILKTSINTKRDAVRESENAFGNFIADTIKEYTNAQIAIINGGTIRGETTYKKNHQISRRDISKELPYRNKVVLINVKGSDILDALENGFSTAEELLGRFPHVSGMQVIYNTSKPVGKRVKTVLINNRPLKKESTYKLATTTYLASGGDGYSMFIGKKNIKYKNPSHRLINDIVIEYITNKKVIYPKIDGRLKDLK